MENRGVIALAILHIEYKPKWKAEARFTHNLSKFSSSQAKISMRNKEFTFDLSKHTTKHPYYYTLI